MKKTRIITATLNIIVLILVFNLGTLAENMRQEITAVEAKDITLNYNNEDFMAKDADGNVVFPLLVEGTSYLPTRAVCDIAGLNVGWNAKTNTILLSEDIIAPSSSVSPDANDDTWLLIRTAREFLMAAKNRDYNTIDAYIAPTGCTFAPFSDRYYPTNDSLITIGKGELQGLANSNENMIWGAYDGRGDAIDLTVDDYFNQFVYNIDFLNAPKIYTNTGVSFPMKETAIENFNTDTIYVDFSYPWIDPQFQGMDWQSMRLVFEKINGEYMVIAVIHGSWTI